VSDTPGTDKERRVLILAPTSRDARLTTELLGRAGIVGETVSDLSAACRALVDGAGALLVAEENVEYQGLAGLLIWLQSQPPWSDLPILVLALPGANSEAVAQAMEQLGNTTVIERPTRFATLVSTVRAALRARQRQYQVRDYIQERERHEEVRSLHAAIVTSSDDAIISKTLEGRILSWNDGAERLFGYSAAEAIGRPITMLIPVERQDEEPALLGRLARGERIEHFETVRVRKDGTRINISLTISPVRDARGRVIGASKIARDITQSRRAAEALQVAQDQLRVVTDHMTVIVARCSRDLRYLWVSHGCARWLGVAPEALIGHRIPDIIGADAFAALRPCVERVLAGAPVECEIEVPYDRRGSRWIKASYVPTRDAGGGIDGWVEVITDTTAHRRMEAALREADRRKDEFLAVLAHELRNPLAPVRSGLHVLRLTAARDPSIERVARIMERQIDHMVRLVDDLLEVSRITRGKIELRREVIDAAQAVRSAIETSRPLIEAARHELTVSMPGEAMMLDADPVRLAQVISNLLNNAAKYTDAGGKISLEGRREAGVAVISVRDSGIGIAPEMLPRVFDLFAQSGRDSARSQGGLGIGLTIVKTLVEMHGGTVEAQSAGPGAGSEFTLRLPLSQTAAASPRPRKEIRPAPALAGRRVLVVDDNQDAADSLGMLLKALGADVHLAYDAACALHLLATERPDVALLDVGMAGMDGYELARHIRRDPTLDGLALIALTGWGQEEDRRRSQSAGFDYHLVKPANIETLQRLLLSLGAPAPPIAPGPPAELSTQPLTDAG